MIVKLKAIKSREDTFCYLFFYLHYSFLWHLVIVTFIISPGRWVDAETSGHIVSLLDCLQISNHWGLELLRWGLVRHRGIKPVCRLIVIVFVIIIWFENCSKWSFLLYHLINPSEVQAIQDIVLSIWWNTHLHPTIHQNLSA